MRIDIVEGDAFKTPLPGDHDVLLIANTVHVFSLTRNLELMRRSRAAVQASARLLLVDLWTDPTHSEPPVAALMSGQFLMMGGEGQTYSEQEADEWLGQTGWRKLERKALLGPAGLIVAKLFRFCLGLTGRSDLAGTHRCVSTLSATTLAARGEKRVPRASWVTEEPSETLSPMLTLRTNCWRAPWAASC